MPPPLSSELTSAALHMVLRWEQHRLLNCATTFSHLPTASRHHLCSMNRIGWVGAAAGISFLFYCGAAVGMSASEGSQAGPRSYSVVGSTEAQWLNALNGVGMLLFQ